MNSASPLSRVVAVLLILVWNFSGSVAPCAESPSKILSKHPVVSSSGTGATTSTKSSQEAAKVILNTDGLVTNSKDLAFMKLFKAELEKRGVRVTISPYCSKANDHVLTIKNCPAGHWVITAASGVCAGTFRDMVLGIRGKNGYLKKHWEKNQIKGLIFLNLSTHQLKGMKFLPKAWDDNFSGASFKGLDNPYEYLTSYGFYVAESSKYTKPVNNANRVPILSDQIASIVGGGSPSAVSADASADEPALARTAKSDTSQSSEKIKTLQKALVAAGYYQYEDANGKKQSYKIDGWFGSLTQQAVMEYQRDHDLSVTGSVDKALYDKLTGAKKETAASSAALSSDKVMSLQRSLMACGYYQGCKIDGDYGPYTREAVKEYQRDHGLQQTGEADTSLMQRIARDATATPAKHPVPAGFEAYLKSSSGTPSSNPKIIAKAKSLAGKTPLESAQNIFRYVESLQYQKYYNTQKGALGVLSTGSGNCVDQAHLVVSLLRASGIPALHGHSTDCKFLSGLRVGHVWAYGYINGTWMPLDTTSSQNRVGQLNSFRPIDPVVKKVELSF
ncbi:MAG TPA: peptidoglycan-binding protein [Candidatus Ozemobacteraceae bacterium]|nr:peptidoglycan-binding protein [Candidatus Ozemobacteraceae bacterium]